MKNFKGNIFDYIQRVDAICVTTNGVVKANGHNVMGAGLAKQFANRYPSLPSLVGAHIKYHNNTTNTFTIPQQKAKVISLPTKNNWKDKSDISLIEQSLTKLVQIADDEDYKFVILTKPGCGLGGLKWVDVKPICEKLLDDRFWIINWYKPRA